MAEKEFSVNYKCPCKSFCIGLDNGSLPLCPDDYTMCKIHMKEKNPDLYKQLFPTD